MKHFDPEERAKEKQASRDEDARALESGEKTRDELRDENGFLPPTGAQIEPIYVICENGKPVWSDKTVFHRQSAAKRYCDELGGVEWSATEHVVLSFFEYVPSAPNSEPLPLPICHCGATETLEGSYAQYCANGHTLDDEGNNPECIPAPPPPPKPSLRQRVLRFIKKFL